MATIKINTLNSAGSELFSDSESYLNALSDAEMLVQGGAICTITPDLLTWTIKTLTTY